MSNLYNCADEIVIKMNKINDSLTNSLFFMPLLQAYNIKSSNNVEKHFEL